MLVALSVAVTIETVLFETDAPDLVLARDAVDGSYLCALTTVSARGHHFLAIQISDKRLASLRSGAIDLREALTKPETPLHLAGWLVPVQGEPAMRLEAVTDVPEEWLPAEGFFLSNFEEYETDNASVVDDALSKNRTVIVYSLNPPESRGLAPRIQADSLAKALSKWQALVRHATDKVLEKASNSLKRSFGPDVAVLEVFSFSPGSFRVHLESKASPNLFGESPVDAALERIDELMELTEKGADAQLEGFKRNQGPFIAAFHNFMKLVVEQKSTVGYRWARPGMAKSSGHQITPVTAAAVCAILKTHKPLGEVEIQFEGRFTSVNGSVEPYSWIAYDTALRRRKGLLHEKAGSLLDGVTIKTETYGFICDQRLEETADGQQVLKLYLKALTTEPA